MNPNFLAKRLMLVSFIVTTLSLQGGDEKAGGEGKEPRPVALEVRIVEVDGTAAKPAGFDWHLGQINNPGGANQPVPAQNSSNSPAVGTVTGILTDPQFKMVIRALEQRDNAKTLAHPSGSVLSGESFLLSRADGWTYEITPTDAAGDGRIVVNLLVKCADGAYKGFALKTVTRVKSGETHVFSDAYPGNEKKKEAKSKRLMIFLTATLQD